MEDKDLSAIQETSDTEDKPDDQTESAASAASESDASESGVSEPDDVQSVDALRSQIAELESELQAARERLSEVSDAYERLLDQVAGDDSAFDRLFGTSGTPAADAAAAQQQTDPRIDALMQKIQTLEQQINADQARKVYETNVAGALKTLRVADTDAPLVKRLIGSIITEQGLNWRSRADVTKAANAAIKAIKDWTEQKRTAKTKKSVPTEPATTAGNVFELPADRKPKTFEDADALASEILSKIPQI